MKNTLKLLALAAAMSLATAASAQQTAGTWLGTLGINKITPKVDSGDVSAPALQAGLGSLAIPGLGPFVAAGPQLRVLGDLSGDLTQLGAPPEQAAYYDGAVRAAHPDREGAGEVCAVRDKMRVDPLCALYGREVERAAESAARQLEASAEATRVRSQIAACMRTARVQRSDRNDRCPVVRK